MYIYNVYNLIKRQYNKVLIENKETFNQLKFKENGKNLNIVISIVSEFKQRDITISFKIPTYYLTTQHRKNVQRLTT